MLAPYATALHAIAVLADDGSGGESKKAGPIALLVILLLAVACFFLFRSMSKHLRRVREEFPVDGGGPPDPPAAPGPTRSAQGDQVKEPDQPANGAPNATDAPS
jgi:hypothetical protein